MLHLSVPNLTSLSLANNNISELGDLEPLKDLKKLKYLNLIGNPVKERKWYREWLVWRLGSLRVLDFQRIRDKVRRLISLVPLRLECLFIDALKRNGKRQKHFSSRLTACLLPSQVHYRQQSRLLLRKHLSTQMNPNCLLHQAKPDG